MTKRLYAVVLILCAVAVQAQPVPLTHAHAHNDYEHKRPLFDALDRGFCSVEADVWLVDGKLLVAHDEKNVSPSRALQSLYLDPIRERAKKNGGRLFKGGPEATLLVDVKSDGDSTYAALRNVLKEYTDILTTFGPDGVTTNAIRVIVSGNRSRSMMEVETIRYAQMDGRLSDLENDDPKHVIGWISDNWTKHFKWRGVDAIPEAEHQKVREIVEKSHQRGCRVRFWATSDSPAVWRELRTAGVDLLNSDNLDGLAKFLRGD